MGRYLIRYRSLVSAREIVAEATALLEGRAADRSSWPSRVPAYIPLSWLVHGSRSRLERLSRLEVRPGTWEGAVAYLAAELLALAPDDVTLRRVQRSALLGVELDVLGHGGRTMANPGCLARKVTAALNSYRFAPPIADDR